MSAELGSRIREVRNAAGITREVLAVRAGLSVATLARLENGQVEPMFSTVKALAQELGCTVGDLMGESVA